MRAGVNLSPAMRTGLNLIGEARRWVFLPALVFTVPILVLIKGGDALSVCFKYVQPRLVVISMSLASLIGLTK